MNSETAIRLADTQHDYHVKDLFNAIGRGDNPPWAVYIQVMKPDEVKSTPVDISDDTFIWPHEQYPLRLVGRYHLDRNVS